jgi:hypothetical protein
VSVPACPICGAADADHIPLDASVTRPWGKQWFCRVCDTVYSGTAEERAYWETREQRRRYENSKASQERHWEIGENRKSNGTEKRPPRARAVPNQGAEQ